MKIKRVFLTVLDSMGIGELPDADKYNDEGSNTLGSICRSDKFSAPNMTAMGLFNIDGVTVKAGTPYPTAAYCRLAEKSKGKDTIIGHWEICGHISERPLAVYPDGFPSEIIERFEKLCGRKVLCNKPYSGTEVIKDYGEEHLSSGALIVYTSADSVFQIAAHEDIVPVNELYRICGIARKILIGEHSVGRVIARPFAGKAPDFYRTSNRRDFSIECPGNTLLDELYKNNLEVIAVGKIGDIFADRGITEKIITHGNAEGMREMLRAADRDFNGLCFVNLVDFDSLYGHRNDVDGYAGAVSEFDAFLPSFTKKMRDGDLLMITADHGCDPATPDTDHSREYTPLLIFGKGILPTNIGTRESFSDIGKTVSDIFGIPADISGESFSAKLFG